MTTTAAATVWTDVASPLGPLLVVGDTGGTVTGCYVANHSRAPRPDAGWRRDGGPLADAVRQLEEYFEGRRRSFDLPLRLHGTPWQQAVWSALLRIPHGATATYGSLAASLGAPGAARAVGSANGANPVSVIVPCHRVVASTGLGGYGWGLPAKRWLLAHEGALPAASLLGGPGD